MISRPYTAPGIGWVLAVVAAILGLLVLIDVVAVTKTIVGAITLLLAGAILL